MFIRDHGLNFTNIQRVLVLMAFAAIFDDIEKASRFGNLSLSMYESLFGFIPCHTGQTLIAQRQPSERQFNHYFKKIVTLLPQLNNKMGVEEKQKRNDVYLNPIPECLTIEKLSQHKEMLSLIDSASEYLTSTIESNVLTEQEAKDEELYEN